MPEIWFEITWPDGRRERCYSPSLVVRDFFAPGQDYRLPDFVARSRAALEEASARVRARYGFACSRALAQLAGIESGAGRFADAPDASVRVERFLEDGA